MIKTKIVYGIDLGTTNSVISRMKDGKPKIIRTESQKDIMPSCISINKKGTILVGESAIHAYKVECHKALYKKIELNTYIEFKRTMGTYKKYYSSHAGKEFTSEELSAEVLKKLKSFVNDEQVTSAIITIPAAFKMNQIDATRRAAEMAGFQYVELLQEPIAAAMAYGLSGKNKNGFWLVFDFGGGTFDSALIKVEEGIIKIIDTEGDNYLGGKNLDYAIVDEILIPYIQGNYNIESILSDDDKRAKYRDALKFWAEEIKNQLSFKDEYNLYVDPGDAGEDDDGEEIEIDITVDREELKGVIAPIIQRAIDLTKKLLQRNNLTGSDLDELILVGGPTLSPVLREMVAEQIKKPNTNVDPMTVVAKGAALYASTIDIPENLKEQTRDKTKIQLEISYEATTVELEEYVTIKLLPNKTEGEIPDKVFAEIKRNDGAWSSGRVVINEIGEVIDVQLIEGKNNLFTIVLFDDKGNILECEPDSFSIIQGTKIGSATLPYNIGIEVKDKTTGQIVFRAVKGLEKNKSLPATGVRNGLKTQKQVRPGMESDFIKIPIYQGEHAADGTRAIYNEHVSDIIISGADLPALLPENSDVDLTIKVDRSQNMTVQAYFPYLDYQTEIEVRYEPMKIETNWLANEIRKAKKSLDDLRSSNIGEVEKINNLTNELNRLEDQFNKNKNDIDTKQEVLNNLRKLLKEVDKFEWPVLEKQLKEAYFKLEKVNAEKGNEQTTKMVNKIKVDVEKVIQEKDRKIAPQLIEDIENLAFELERLEHLIGFILFLDDNFNNTEIVRWKDRNAARIVINKGKEIIIDNPSIERLQPIVNELWVNAGFNELKNSISGIDPNILIG